MLSLLAMAVIVTVWVLICIFAAAIWLFDTWAEYDYRKKRGF